MQVGDGFLRIASPLTIGRNDEQWDLALFGRGPTMRAIIVDPMVAGDQDRVSKFLPLYKERAKEGIFF